MVKVGHVEVDHTIVELHDGLKTEIDGKPIPYTRVVLRAPCQSFDLQAVQAAERLVMVNGAPQLKMSEEVYRTVMTMLRIDRFECTDANMAPIRAHEIDLNLIGRLHPFDVAKIEQGVLLYDMVEAVRFGNITQQAFDDLYNPKSTEPQPPQHEGEAREGVQETERPRGSRPPVGRLDQ